MNQKTIGFLGALAILAVVPASAFAQSTAGALQLGLGTDFVSYSKVNETWKLPAGNQDGEVATTQWGFGNRNNVYLEGGYGFGASMVFGGILALGGISQTVQNDTTESNKNNPHGFDFLIAPKFDYMFLPESRVRPYVGALLGVSHHSETVERTNNQNVTVTQDDQSYTGLNLEGRVGARIFVTPGFSLDPALAFGWMPTASGSRRLNAGNAQQNGARYDLSADGYSIGLSLTASGWLEL